MQTSDWHLLFCIPPPFFLKVPSFLFLFLFPQQFFLFLRQWTESAWKAMLRLPSVFPGLYSSNFHVWVIFLFLLISVRVLALRFSVSSNLIFFFLFYFSYSMPMMHFFISLPSWVTYDMQICNWHFIARQVPLPNFLFVFYCIFSYQHCVFFLSFPFVAAF